MNRPEAPVIPDVQSHPDARELAIDRVGIRDLRYPLRFADGEGEPVSTIASCNLYVALPAERKGTHMSRLVSVIDDMTDPLTLAALPRLLQTLLTRLESEAGCVEIAFPWFLRKAAPVSGAQSMMDYEVRLSAEALDGRRTVGVTVVVPVMSLCPSSKAMADYGAHNQRSHLTLSVHPRQNAGLKLAELIAKTHFSISTDETRPHLNDPRFEGFSVSAENFESIHNHSAYAEIMRHPDQKG